MHLIICEYQEKNLLHKHTTDLKEGKLFLGRGAGCNIVLGHFLPPEHRLAISRIQATISWINGIIKIIDGDERQCSKNGLWVGMRQIESTEIPDDRVTLIDIFRSGNYRIIAEFHPGKLPAAPTELEATYTGEEVRHLLEIKDKIESLTKELSNLKRSQSHDDKFKKSLKKLLPWLFITPLVMLAVALFPGGHESKAATLLKETFTAMVPALVAAVFVYQEKMAKEED